MNDRKITTIVFDGGDTLIKVDPQYSGKMKNWPELIAVPDAQQILKELSNHFQIFVASNAEDSNAQDVSEAMLRVGLNDYIQQYFTVNELGTKKPDLSFYKNLCAELQKSPEEIIMIGDDYHNDILPALMIGIHTIWFNPKNLVATAHLPLQEMECFSLNEIPDIVNSSPLPDYQTSLGWYMQQGATHTLLAHVNMVAAASYQLSIWLKSQGIEISPLLAHRGGLLHDLAKLKENGVESHAILAKRMLENLGQPELAKIAGHHLIGDLSSNNSKPNTWEEKVVNYCDKLTEGSELVSLDERLEALKLRYPYFKEKIQKNTPKVKDLEAEILAPLGLNSEEALQKLKKSLFNKN
ncbi:MAG: HAD-IA family hydrolase [Anaerolineaceae bacterium]